MTCVEAIADKVGIVMYEKYEKRDRVQVLPA